MFKKKLSLAIHLWMAIPMAIGMAMALPLFTTGQAAMAQSSEAAPADQAETAAPPSEILAQKNRHRIQVITQALEQSPDDINLYNARGWYYFQLGEYQLTLTDYERVIELGVENLRPVYQPAVYYVRGISYASLEKPALAIESLQMGIELYSAQGNEQAVNELTRLIQQLQQSPA